MEERWITPGSKTSGSLMASTLIVISSIANPGPAKRTTLGRGARLGRGLFLDPRLGL
jgi:hypothetical protein